MKNLNNYIRSILLLAVLAAGCKAPGLVQEPGTLNSPDSFNRATDTLSTATLSWRHFFADEKLAALIDTALAHNQELLIAWQETEIAKNEIRLRKGQLIPTVTGGAGIGIDKVGRYTSQGAGDASTEITPGKGVPEVLPDYRFGVFASWEVDIWHKLHDAKKAATHRYLSTIEGRNFLVTNLVAEVANSYYELESLDNQLAIVQQTIGLQQQALDIVKVQKQAAAATELAVKKFQAEVLHSKSLQFEIKQQQRETENHLNFLLGRYPQPIERSDSLFLAEMDFSTAAGVPAQLIANRPDIRQAEQELDAARLDVKVARAEFFPSLGITAGLGFEGFSPAYLVRFPESLLFNLAGDLAGPLINKNAIKAEYGSASARQLQSLYEYQKRILNGYVEVSGQLSNLQNLDSNFSYRKMEVDTLDASINISNELFRYAHADYLEVLTTQRDALNAKLDLVETRLRQFQARANLYQALGGGWR